MVGLFVYRSLRGETQLSPNGTRMEIYWNMLKPGLKAYKSLLAYYRPCGLQNCKERETDLEVRDLKGKKTKSPLPANQVEQFYCQSSEGVMKWNYKSGRHSAL